MTEEALNVSFGKFLELSFMARILESGKEHVDAKELTSFTEDIPKSRQFMHRDRYFGCGKRVARLTYKTEQPLKLRMRTKFIGWDTALQVSWLVSEFLDVETIVFEVFKGIQDA